MYSLGMYTLVTPLVLVSKGTHIWSGFIDIRVQRDYYL